MTDPSPLQSIIAIYPTESGQTRLSVRLDEGTAWLSQAQLAELYQTTPQNITMHIRGILADGELREEATCKEFLQVRREGSREVARRLRHYNLEMILAVGYRVRSTVGTRFRQWVTELLSEYIVKGFTLDDERLKGRDARADYFDELLARIRDIRASEQRAYQRIREILAMAVDYDEDEQATKTFFARMQNKMHFAATGLTAAEIIRHRADAAKANMGLTSWTGGRVLKRDVATAKNYLQAAEIDTLNRIVVMFLDQAEFRAQRRRDIRMNDWEGLLDKFLYDTDLPVLADAGSVRHKDAVDWAEVQYDAFAERRRKQAESAGDAGYLEDLRESARAIESNSSPTGRNKQQKHRKGRGDG